MLSGRLVSGWRAGRLITLSFVVQCGRRSLYHLLLLRQVILIRSCGPPRPASAHRQPELQSRLEEESRGLAAKTSNRWILGLMLVLSISAIIAATTPVALTTDTTINSISKENGLPG